MPLTVGYLAWASCNAASSSFVNCSATCERATTTPGTYAVTTSRGLGAEILTVAIVLSGVAIFGYFAAQIVDAVAHGILGGAWKEKKRRKMIDGLHDHIIVCGYGRVGRRAGEELRRGGTPYV